MNKYIRRPDVVEMVMLANRALTTDEAWEMLESIGISKSSSGRPDWVKPTSSHPRMIAFGFTKIGDEVFDGDISYDGRQVAVFRFGRFI
jgi:hypothetical protein